MSNNEEQNLAMCRAMEDINELATGDRHNYLDTWTVPLNLNIETIDDVKKRNLIWLFNYHISVIEKHTTVINRDVKHTSASELIILCNEAIEKYDEFFELDKDNAKVSRWLGYVQGVLITIGLLSVDSERNFTRARLTEHRNMITDESESFTVKFSEAETIGPGVREFAELRKTPSIFNPPMFANLKNITGVDADGNITVTPVDCSVVLVKVDDKFLGVSRRDNHTDIGLPGGKRERDESFETCAVREALEETGYRIELIDTEPFYDHDSGHFCVTFLATITNPNPEPVDSAEGIVGFFDKQLFIDGSFGAYNKKMFEHFKL